MSELYTKSTTNTTEYIDIALNRKRIKNCDLGRLVAYDSLVASQSLNALQGKIQAIHTRSQEGQ